MGRLFWKFFLFTWLVQLAGMAAVMTAFWYTPSSFAPMLPEAMMVLGSLVSAALLARYFAAPIRSLRAAFSAAASGNLDVKLQRTMARRHDELADLGEHFDRMTFRLREVLDGQRRLLHDVSHELRSPLARLQVATGLARQQPENVNAYLQRIEQEAERMDVLIEELLTLARWDASVAQPPNAKIDLAELVDGVIHDTSFEAAVNGGGVVLASTCHATVRGDAEMLRRAIENVVRNAVKHGAPGATANIELTTDYKEGSATVRVLDRGPGVLESELTAIFQPFFRGENSGQWSAHGHGLGLTISRRIINAHGGRITARNRVDGGLCVDIVLPSA